MLNRNTFVILVITIHCATATPSDHNQDDRGYEYNEDLLKDITYDIEAATAKTDEYILTLTEEIFIYAIRLVRRVTTSFEHDITVLTKHLEDLAAEKPSSVCYITDIEASLPTRIAAIEACISIAQKPVLTEVLPIYEHIAIYNQIATELMSGVEEQCPSENGDYLNCSEECKVILYELNEKINEYMEAIQECLDYVRDTVGQLETDMMSCVTSEMDKWVLDIAEVKKNVDECLGKVTTTPVPIKPSRPTTK